MNTIRLFDITLSLLCLLLITPLLLLIALIVKLGTKGPVLYKQVRVGKGGKDFGLYKFRTMKTGADKAGLLTVGGRDSRITAAGFYLRKFKLDELPQVYNVLKGDMSIVGPRPEVRHYVKHYTKEQQQVLNVLPGITDYASIAFRNENDLLAKAANPEEYYISEIIPKKIALNTKFIENRNIKEYLAIICKTLIVAAKGS